MDYSDMQAMALRAGVEPVKSAYVIFCDNIDALNELEDYIVKKYENIYINDQFQDNILLINTKNEQYVCIQWKSI